MLWPFFPRKLSLIILAAGESVRFNHPKPKQLMLVEGETVIGRTVRQFRTAAPVYVVTKNNALVPRGAKKFVPAARRWTSETLLSTRPLWGRRTIILLGDTYFTDAAVSQILSARSAMTYFSDGQDIFALSFDLSYKPLFTKALKYVIAHAEGPNGNYGRLWETYRRLFGLPKHPMLPEDHLPHIDFIGDRTQDFDLYPEYVDFCNGISKNYLFNGNHRAYSPQAS